jgi:hypothetical protein
VKSRLNILQFLGNLEMQEIKISGIPKEAELRRDGCGQWIMLLPFHALLLRLLQEWNIS